MSTLLFSTPIKPIPQSIDYDPTKAVLGKKLFFDPILSKNNTIACVDCHDLQHGGDDGFRISIGEDGRKGTINAPTVYNAGFNFRQFWNGRAKDLKEQVAGPITNHVEMANTMAKAVAALKKKPEYVEAFKRCYPEGITEDTLADVIAEFERALITPNASFDRYLRGDKNALSEQEKNGYRLFEAKGCILCHNGINIGGNFYNKFGIFKESNSTSLGRYDITKRREDKYVFKVPSLRNVALTAPYMHDGRAKTLKEAVEIMTEHQLGRYMAPEETDAIVAFLKSLTGDIPPIAKEE